MMEIWKRALRISVCRALPFKVDLVDDSTMIDWPRGAFRYRENLRFVCLLVLYKIIL